MRRAIALIHDLGADLDRRLPSEARASERLRMLREATNRITRAANDAIQAYGRGSRTVSSELKRDGRRAEAALTTQSALRAARTELLALLSDARRRYPWADAADGDAPATPAAPTSRTSDADRT